MNKLFYLIIFFVILGCSNNKSTYWCGDHPCINNKEKEDYFKKTMIVEMKEFKKENKKNNSEIEKIMQQARMNEKKRIEYLIDFLTTLEVGHDKTPILVLSGFIDEALKKKFKKKSHIYFLEKPIDKETLEETLVEISTLED